MYDDRHFQLLSDLIVTEAKSYSRDTAMRLIELRLRALYALGELEGAKSASPALARELRSAA